MLQTFQTNQPIEGHGSALSIDRQSEPNESIIKHVMMYSPTLKEHDSWVLFFKFL